MLSKILNRIRPSKSTTKLANSSIASTSGAGTYGCDSTVGMRPIFNQPLNLYEQIQQSELLYFSDWQAQKIIDIVPNDMLREGWTYSGLDNDQIVELESYLEALDIQTVLFDALRLERLHGGSAVFIGIRGDVDDPTIPLDTRNVQPQDLRFLNVVDRRRISRQSVDVDPTSPAYGRPDIYYLNGEAVHRSRLLVFRGSPLLPIQAATVALPSVNSNDGFGVPMLMRLWNDLLQATGSRQAAFQLIQRASTLVFSGELQSMMESDAGAANIGALEKILRQVGLYGAAMLNSVAGETAAKLETISANFGSVPELVISYLQVLSAASDIPATRFLGQAPGGLNATGVSDLENYYTRIVADQNKRLRLILNQILAVAIPSALSTPFDPTEVSIEFNPLWSLSATENAAVRQIDTQNVVATVNSGLITDDDGLAELKLRGVLLNEDATVDPDFQDAAGFDSPDVQGELDGFLRKSDGDSITPGGSDQEDKEDKESASS